MNYIYTLMEDDAIKLRNFEYRSSVYQWLKILATRFFIKKFSQFSHYSSTLQTTL